MEITHKGPGNLFFPTPIIPYDWQIPIIKKMMEKVLAGENGLVIQPTATGKSVEAAFVSRAAILMHNKRGLYLYNENEGLDQARERFEFILNKNKVLCANFFGYGKDEHVDTAQMVFASFQSMNNHHEKWYKMLDSEHFDFIIVNEAHHGQAVTYKEVLDYFVCSKIGMTATPERMDGKDILEIFNEVIYEISLEEAIAKGLVAQVEYHVLSHGLSTQKLKELCREVLEEGKRISIKQLNETIFIDALDDMVMKEIYNYALPENDNPRQTLIFCENIEHAERVYDFLHKDGKSAEVIHSKRGKLHNRLVMQNFRKGTIQFLVSINKLNEDIDVPNVEVTAFLRSTDSSTIFFQQLGRPLRKTPTKEKAIILDFVANAERLIIVRNLLDRVKEATEKFRSEIPLSTDAFHISGHGFDFSFTDDIVNVLNLIQAIKTGYFPTWQEASKVCVEANMQTKGEYKKNYKKIDMRLHSKPDSFYLDFPTWKVFLGTKYPTWEDASIACKRNGILSSEDYTNLYNSRRTKREDKKLPRDPITFYKDFPGWGKFLGFQDVPKGWTLLEKAKVSDPRLIKFLDYCIQKYPNVFEYFWEENRACKYVNLNLLPNMDQDLKEHKASNILRSILEEAQRLIHNQYGPYNNLGMWRGFNENMLYPYNKDLIIKFFRENISLEDLGYSDKPKNYFLKVKELVFSGKIEPSILETIYVILEKELTFRR